MKKEVFSPEKLILYPIAYKDLAFFVSKPVKDLDDG